MNLRDRIGITERRQRQLTWAMEVGLVGMFFIGLDRGTTGIVVNTGIALLVTRLPSVLEHDFGIPMDPGLTLWITSAVFLHAFGTVGLPGSPLTPYQSVWWYDHLTHGLSASVVAAVGYAAVRALDVHSDEVSYPPEFTVVFVFLFVLAFGVLWEVIEFTVAELAAVLGTGSVLTQYGLEDTMLDLIFDTVGAAVVAIWGGARLSGVVSALADRFDAARRGTER
ncbi:hypothetical protein [Halococcus saccharolyticus]|uniref:Membrane-spanning protein n=1 Tax=Halococcus saccharolyticus DSM 5350 TaxID=1227455 RepID=M0MEJ1_9EURY|nr:hypothetical protein [Halococcus saccharolyticus]EMA44146.1 hypothetical protein C449_11488 [Halococcus saccharolyticus DSM 5350]